MRLNRAVAVADGPAAGPALVDDLADEVTGHLLPTTWADLLRRLGRTTEALAACERALAPTDAERRHLTRVVSAPRG